MMRFITKNKAAVYATFAAAFWLLAWQLYSDYLGQEILMVSPVSVVKTLAQLAGQRFFWASVAGTCGRILAGFSMAAASGVLLAVLSHALRPIKALLSPLMLVFKSVPVASFVLLLLFYIPSKNLSVPVSFVMVLPIIYTNTLEGIAQTDRRIIEMAEVFRLPLLRRLAFVYLPQVMPYFVSACSVALGLAWKSGVAAEVIGLPTGSIGERLYRAKVYLLTGELFAWTLVVILISLAAERLFMLLLKRMPGLEVRQ